MLIKDLVTLAKAGFTPAQVKELLSMETGTQPEVEETPEAVPKEETQPEAEKTKTEAEPQTLPEDMVSELNKQILELQNELETNKKKLQEAQQKNTSADISSAQKPKSEQEVLNGIAADFM